MPPAWHALMPKKRLSRTVCAAIATDEKARLALLKSGIRDEKITVVRNGANPLREVSADERAALQKSLGIPDGTFVAGIFARLEAVKDHATVIEAARLCEGNGGGIYFLIVGTGSLEVTLKKNAPRCVRFCGFADDIAPYMSLCRANINASRGTETSNLAVIEGMSAGVVPVVSDYGSNPALAKDCGLVFEAGNSAALRDALLRLKNNQTLAATLSAAAKDAFLREYSAERFAREIDEVYENALRFHKCKVQSAKCKVKDKSG
jgi:glycosyltransferase involved in cell wall biosynthesis